METPDGPRIILDEDIANPYTEVPPKEVAVPAAEPEEVESENKESE